MCIRDSLKADPCSGKVKADCRGVRIEIGYAAVFDFFADGRHAVGEASALLLSLIHI